MRIMIAGIFLAVLAFSSPALAEDESTGSEAARAAAEKQAEQAKTPAVGSAAPAKAAAEDVAKGAEKAKQAKDIAQ